MMDVSGTDPRTRTGLFLWPWASYPAVAANAAANAHNPHIAMGPTSGNAVGAHMFGVPNSGAMNVPAISEDPLETFYQRFSYPNAHAVHMSNILPQHQHFNTNDSRTISRDRSDEHSSSLHQDHTSATSSSRSIGPLASVQNVSHLSRLGDTLDEHLNIHRGQGSSHAAAIAAFASVAANSNVMNSVDGTSQGGLHMSHVPRHLHHGLPRNTMSSDMVLDSLCNGLGRSGSQFVNNLPNGCSGLRNGSQSNTSPTSVPTNSSPISKSSTDPLNVAYNHLRPQNLKDFSNTAAAAALVAAVASDPAQFASHVIHERENMRRTPNEDIVSRSQLRSSTLDETDSREQVASHPSVETYQTPHHYGFPTKSPLSDSCESAREHISTSMARRPMDFMRTGRLMSDLRDKSASMLFQPSAMRDCSSDATSEYRSPEMAMSTRDSVNSLRSASGRGSGMGLTPSPAAPVPAPPAMPTLPHESGANDTSRTTAEASLGSMTNTSTSYTHATKGYKCKTCQHVCYSRHDLSVHNTAVHKQDPRPYRCEHCGRPFATCAYLSQHRRIHTGVKPYACRYCDRRFTQLSHVQQHERIHTGEKPYRCTTCMKSFTQMSNLQSHQRQHMKGKPHRCEQCFMSFDSKDELDVHVQAKHSGNRYGKVLVCPICTKSYNSETYLAKHLDRHKEAANTVPSEASSLSGTQSASMDDFFAANFHNHPMAMAAAALSRGSGGGPHTPTDAAMLSRHHIPNAGSHHVVSAAAAAAAVAAAAAAVSVCGPRHSDRGFFNNNTTNNNTHNSNTDLQRSLVHPRITTPPSDNVHNDPLNYSNESDLFQHLPSHLHSSHAANLVAASQQSQLGKLSHLANPFSDFRSHCSFPLGPSDSYHSDMPGAMHTKRNLDRLALAASNQASPHPNVNEQQLLNLTQSQPIIRGGQTHKRRALSSTSSPDQTEHYVNTRDTRIPESHLNPPPAPAPASLLNHHHRHHHQQQQQQQQQHPHQHLHSHASMLEQQAHLTHVPDRINPGDTTAILAPPPAHQDPHNFRLSRSHQMGALTADHRTRQPPNESLSTTRQLNSERVRSSSSISENDTRPYSVMQSPSNASSTSPPIHSTIHPVRLTRSEPSDIIQSSRDTSDALEFLLQHQKMIKTSSADNVTTSTLTFGQSTAELRINVDMHCDDSGDSMESTHSGKLVTNTCQCENERELHSVTPLSTPLMATMDTSSNEHNTNTSVVSELAKMLPRSGHFESTNAYSETSGCLMSTQTASIATATGANGNSITTTASHQSNMTTTADLQLSTSGLLKNEPPDYSQHIHQVCDTKTKVTNASHHANTFVETHLATSHTMFYPPHTDTEDPIKSSWANRELIPPKVTHTTTTEQHNKHLFHTRTAYTPYALAHMCNDMESHSSNVSTSSSKTNVLNVPFYLDTAWRQYASHQEHASTNVSPTTTKKRRRHQYVPQHVSSYATHEVSHDDDYVGTNYYPTSHNETLSDDGTGAGTISTLSSAITSASMSMTSVVVTSAFYTTATNNSANTTASSPVLTIPEHGVTHTHTTTANTTNTHGYDTTCSFPSFHF